MYRNFVPKLILVLAASCVVFFGLPYLGHHLGTYLIDNNFSIQQTLMLVAFAYAVFNATMYWNIHHVQNFIAGNEFQHLHIRSLRGYAYLFTTAYATAFFAAVMAVELFLGYSWLSALGCVTAAALVLGITVSSSIIFAGYRAQRMHQLNKG